MTAAIFALAGTLLGVLGTLAVELTRSRAENLRDHREALRLTCANFTAAVVRMRTLAYEVMQNPANAEQIESMREAHREARVNYEQLRLTASTIDVQKAARYVLRYAYGLLRQAEGKPLREEERERGPLRMIHDWLMILYVDVRRELRLSQADEVYREPDEWIADPGAGTSAPSA